jgi:hypothetical protein
MSEAERFIRDRRSPIHVPRTTVPGELTPEERQDLITPPSGRLPLEGARLTQTEAATVGSERMTEPKGITWDQLEDMGTTWNDLENARLVRVQAPPASAPPEATKRWWHGLSGMGKWLVGIFGTIIAGVVVLLIRTWLISQGLVRP